MASVHNTCGGPETYKLYLLYLVVRLCRVTDIVVSDAILMNNPEPILIHQLIQRLIAQSPHQHKMMEASIIHAWHCHMPAIIRRGTKRIYVKQNKIFVEITSSPLRHELQNAKQAIVKTLQEHVPGYIIDDIVFIA